MAIYIINCNHSLSPNFGQATVLSMTLVTNSTYPSTLPCPSSSWLAPDGSSPVPLPCPDAHLQSNKNWLVSSWTPGNTTLAPQWGHNLVSGQWPMMGVSLEIPRLCPYLVQDGRAHLSVDRWAVYAMWTSHTPWSQASSSIPSTYTCLWPPTNTIRTPKWRRSRREMVGL